MLDGVKCKISMNAMLGQESTLVFKFRSVSSLLLKNFSKINSPTEQVHYNDNFCFENLRSGSQSRTLNSPSTSFDL